MKKRVRKLTRFFLWLLFVIEQFITLGFSEHFLLNPFAKITL